MLLLIVELFQGFNAKVVAIVDYFMDLMARLFVDLFQGFDVKVCANFLLFQGFDGKVCASCCVISGILMPMFVPKI